MSDAKPPSANVDRSTFIETLPTGDKMEKVPGKIPVSDLKVLGHPDRPIDAIRANCRQCSGGSTAEVRKCVAVACPLWPFRMGYNPYHGSFRGR